MPQIVKGGKYVFGWSIVGKNGEIKIPGEAVEEYNFKPKNKVFIITGSKTSGGFSIVKVDKLRKSPLSIVLEKYPELSNFELSKDDTISYRNRIYIWSEFSSNGSIILPIKTLKLFGIKPGDHVLSIRGSNLGLGIAIKGPIINEAKKHGEIKIF